MNIRGKKKGQRVNYESTNNYKHSREKNYQCSAKIYSNIVKFLFSNIINSKKFRKLKRAFCVHWEFFFTKVYGSI